MESFEDNCKVQENEIIINADALNGLDRFFTRGTYASKFGLFSLGHVGVVHGLDDEDLTPWMDEHAVRIRAGIMHIFSWMSFINIMFVKGAIILSVRVKCTTFHEIQQNLIISHLFDIFNRSKICVGRHEYCFMGVPFVFLLWPYSNFTGWLHSYTSFHETLQRASMDTSEAQAFFLDAWSLCCWHLSRFVAICPCRR